jgi:hypothetical protein
VKIDILVEIDEVSKEIGTEIGVLLGAIYGEMMKRDYHEGTGTCLMTDVEVALEEEIVVIVIA